MLNHGAEPGAPRRYAASLTAAEGWFGVWTARKTV